MPNGTQTTYMNLTRWGNATDYFDYQQLATNFDRIDAHDHGANGGKQISASGIVTGAITSDLLSTSPPAVSSNNIQPLAINASHIGTETITKDKIDFTSLAPLTSTVPSTSGQTEGNIIYYTNNTSAASHVWTLRYTNIGSGVYKWVFIGGSTRATATSTGQNLTSANYTLLSNTSVSSLPPGRYEVTFGATINIYINGDPSPNYSTVAYVGFGTSTSLIGSEIVYNAPAIGYDTNTATSLSRTSIVDYSTTTTLNLYGKASGTNLTNNGDTNAGRMFISVRPIYLNPS
jgi:hypothetical protein